MYRALWYRRFGHPEAVLSLETAPLSTPGADQVQVMMIAAPINPSDGKRRWNHTVIGGMI